MFKANKHRIIVIVPTLVKLVNAGSTVHFTTSVSQVPINWAERP